MILKIIFLSLLCIPLLYVSMMLLVKLLREVYTRRTPR